LRNRISAAIAFAILVLAAPPVAVRATAPSVVDLDASARAAGNRLDIATQVGRRVFQTTWPVQISQISANELGSHLVIGIRLWGVKFHHPMTRKDFTSEIADVVSQAFAAAPGAEEVDVWTSVPIDVGKDVVVNGDLAKPTSKTVFSLSVRRGENVAAIAARAYRSPGAFWDEEWARAAFKKQGS
jgi:hypothetical protein